MNTRCVVCGVTSTRSLTLCPKCHQPHHSKCSSKKKDALCNRCHKVDKPFPLNESANATKQKSLKASECTTLTRSLRGMPTATELAASHHRNRLSSSTPAGRRSSHSSSTYTNASLLDAIIEPVGQVAGAPGAAKRKGLGPKTAERENWLRTEQSAADVSTSQETALITPHNTMRHNNLNTSKNYVKNNVSEVSNNDISNAAKNKKLEKASQSKRRHTKIQLRRTNVSQTSLLLL